MKKIRDVLRLTFELGLSRRKVADATGIGRTAVTDYVQRAGAAGMTWPLPDGLDDAELERRLYPPGVPAKGTAGIEPDWTVIHAEMKRRGVTMTARAGAWRPANPVDGDHHFQSMTTTCSGPWRPGQQGCARL